MTRPNYEPGNPRRVRLIVLHDTEGSAPGDYEWLRTGGSPANPISTHYYIAPNGAITQFVDDADIAWHAGVSSWVVDGKRVSGCNAVSIGVELSNRGHDPYPPAQYAAAVALVRDLVARYAIPRAQLVRHLDIAPGRKTDPAGFPWPRFVVDVYASPAPVPPPPAPTTPLDAPIFSLPRCSLAQAQRVWAVRGKRGEYEVGEVAAILGWYWETCAPVGVDPCLAVAQMDVETGGLTSALSQRSDRDGHPLRNPAGIGVNGETSPGPAPGFVWDSDRQQYRRCVGFAAWKRDSIPAHIGRLLAYALRDSAATPAQRDLIALALHARALPPQYRGAASTLRLLEGKWNGSPGTYAASIARIMDEMRRA